MSANNILDYLTIQDIYDCELKRIRSNINQKQKVDLIEYKGYDVVLSKTSQGINQNACFKITFGKSLALNAFQYVSDKLWIRTFLVYPYMFFEISQVPTEHARTLSFQVSRSYDGKSTSRGALTQKIVCDTAQENAFLELFVGKYCLLLDEKTNLYYINAYQSIKED